MEEMEIKHDRRADLNMKRVAEVFDREECASFLDLIVHVTLFVLKQKRQHELDLSNFTLHAYIEELIRKNNENIKYTIIVNT